MLHYSPGDTVKYTVKENRSSQKQNANTLLRKPLDLIQTLTHDMDFYLRAILILF